jgi:hypothetical protein
VLGPIAFGRWHIKIKRKKYILHIYIPINHCRWKVAKQLRILEKTYSVTAIPNLCHVLLCKLTYAFISVEGRN